MFSDSPASPVDLIQPQDSEVDDFISCIQKLILADYFETFIPSEKRLKHQLEWSKLSQQKLSDF